MIIFPTGGVFAELGGMGVSMFFVSCVLVVLSLFLYFVKLFATQQNRHRAVDVHIRRKWIRGC